MSIEDRNLKPGTVLVARYKKRNHRCEVVKGAEGKVAFRVGGKEYGSPSGGGERRTLDPGAPGPKAAGPTRRLPHL
jgi:hypothetical protein